MRAVRRTETITEDAIERALKRFRIVLRGKTLKMSKVRAAIARAALTYDGHFSVEDLVRTLHENRVRDAHTATVYRSVPLMIEAGLIEPALTAKQRGQCYESTFERAHHDHLVCTACGEFVEFHSEALEALQREIAERFGFALDDHVHELRGRCQSCRQAGVKSVAPHALDP